MKSWDFFDTLFNRKCSIENLYALVESKSSIIGLKNQRLQAERLLYSKIVDPNLEAIYTYLGFDLVECKRLISIEELLESELLMPNKILLSKVKSNDIILSDTHHSSKFLRSLVIKYKPELKNIKILVSNETGNRKSDGSMFNAGYTPILTSHRGDNFHSDVKMCLRSGRIPIYNRDARQIRQCKSFVDDFYYKVGRSYTQREGVNSSLQPFVVAPLLFEWAQSIIQRAVQINVEKIVFLSRDMYLVKHIVDEILNIKNLEIQTEYLFISRNSLLCSTDIDKADWRDRMIRACSPFENYDNKQELFDKSVQNDYLISYLNRVFSVGCNLIVDVGWKLTSQHLLQELVASDKHLKGYYFGIKDVVDRKIDASAFCYDERVEAFSHCSRKICDELVNPLESLLAAPHRRILLYDMNGPVIIPEDIEKRVSVSRDLDAYLRYTKIYLMLNEGRMIARGALVSFLHFIKRPNRSMLLELNESLNTEFDSSKPLLAKVSFGDLVRFNLDASLWPKGSLIMSFPMLFKLYRILTNALDKD